jgi:hypothetical protein
MNEIPEFSYNEIQLEEQVLCCPSNWTEIYEQRMIKHKVPYKKRMWDKSKGEFCFILSRKYRPHAWKLPEPE